MTTPSRSKHHHATMTTQTSILVISFSLFIILFSLFYLNAHPHLSIFFKLNPSLDPKELHNSKIAVCLVGGARRFELTGPSIVKNILKEYPNADLFLNSWLDEDSYKFSVLADALRIASVRIRKPERVEESEAERRVLSSWNSPNGIQGLLQYFTLVEGCLDLIHTHSLLTNTTYSWILRTRVDGYWSSPLPPSAFSVSSYSVPLGSRFGGLNDRFGLGTFSASYPALSRLFLIPKLDTLGLKNLNSESAFKAQLDSTGTKFREVSVPFCVVSDRQYGYPPAWNGVPVMSMGSKGELSGAKCRPCRAVCKGECVGVVVGGLGKEWGWVDGKKERVEVCDGSGGWEKGWESVFDEVAGTVAAEARRRVEGMGWEGCVEGWEGLRGSVRGSWEGPSGEEVCRLGGFVKG